MASNKNKGVHKAVDSKTEEQKQLIEKINKLEPIKATDSKDVIKNKLSKTADALNSIMTMDSFKNQMARVGFGQPNLMNGAEYPMNRMSYNFNLFTSMYRSSWLVRKIVDVVPADMLKNWITIKSGLEPDKITKIQKAMRKTKTKQKLKEALQWSRLYGGAIALIIIDGQDDMLEQPLDYDTIMPDQYKGLIVFDRWSGVYPTGDIIDDLDSTDFGEPKYYDISTASVSPISTAQNLDKSKMRRVHHSRILKFKGRILPYWESIYEQGWGESEIEIAYEELTKRDNTSANIASLIFLANIRVLKMNDLGQLLGANTQQAQENLWNTLEAQNQIMSNMGLYVMDKEDDFSTHQYSFGGLNDIYESFMLDVAGACEMPVTKLFGRNPAGFNATGENDLIQYYDTIEEKQESYLMPVIDKLLPIICMSAIGSYPEDIDWDFNPVMSVSNKDMAELAKSYTDIIMEPVNLGIVDKVTALRELKQQSDITGIWTNITDEMIQEAMEEDNDISEEEQEQIRNDISLNESELSSNKVNNIGSINSKEDRMEASDDSFSLSNWMKRFKDTYSKKYTG